MLPAWFLSRCAPEQTQEQAEKWQAYWRSLSAEERVRVDEETPWSLGGWLYWMEPDNRYWFWWDADVVDRNTIRVAVEVNEWPFPWGSLRWLFKAAGAKSFVAEE